MNFCFIGKEKEKIIRCCEDRTCFDDKHVTYGCDFLQLVRMDILIVAQNPSIDLNESQQRAENNSKIEIWGGWNVKMAEMSDMAGVEEGLKLNLCALFICELTYQNEKNQFCC